MIEVQAAYIEANDEPPRILGVGITRNVAFAVASYVVAAASAIVAQFFVSS
jgi:hypothetical protein